MSYMDQVREFCDEYMGDRPGEPVSAHEIAAWAIDGKKWAPGRSQMISQCADLIAHAMREHYFTDRQGRRARAKHAVTVKRGSKQLHLWIDMRDTTRDLMELSLQQRRQQIFGDCRQLKTDADCYNENYNSGAAIQPVLNFEPDIAEFEALKKKGA
jgi:hypothetical protein